MLITLFEEKVVHPVAELILLRVSASVTATVLGAPTCFALSADTYLTAPATAVSLRLTSRALSSEQGKRHLGQREPVARPLAPIPL